MKPGPPPAVGAKLYGPSRTEAEDQRGPFAGVFHVRAVVDHEISEKWGHSYQVVLRYWSPRKGWRYHVECQYAFTSMGNERPLYAPEPA